MARRLSYCLFFLLTVLLTASAPALAETTHKVELTITNDEFVPATLKLPADTKIQITVHNHSKMPAEFESTDLSREVIVLMGSSVNVSIGPLKPGTYGFFNDFNRRLKGQVIVDAPTQGD